jgi:uncharacterized protein YoxC
MPIWVDVFIVVAAAAIIVQMGVLLGMWMEVRALVPVVTRTMADVTTKTDDLKTKLDPILIRANRILEDSEERISGVMEDAAEISTRVRMQAARVDDLLTDVNDRLRLQVMRVDDLTSGVISLVEDAGVRLSKPVKSSVNEASAVLTGIKAGLDALRNRRRPRTAGSGMSPDEELFI